MSRTKRVSREFNRYRGPTNKGTHRDTIDSQYDERGPTKTDRKYREKQYRHQAKIVLNQGLDELRITKLPTNPIKDWI